MSFAGQDDVVVPLHTLSGGGMTQHQRALTNAGAGGKKDGSLAVRQAGGVNKRIAALEELQTEQRLDIEGLEERDDKLATAFKENPYRLCLEVADSYPPVNRL